MSDHETLFAARCRKEDGYQDIWEHLPKIREIAAKVRHVTEFGVRTGNSRIALLCGLIDGGGGRLIGYDIKPCGLGPDWPQHPTVEQIFIEANTGELREIEPTDLLFVDSDHRYEHVSRELRMAKHVRRFIVMHDTNKERDRQFGDGVVPARDDFLKENPEWQMVYHADNCNGLSILERMQ